MATLTVRNIDDGVKQRLRIQAARKGHSMEEEVRRILAVAVDPAPPYENAADAIRRIVDPIGGIELELLPRERVRPPPNFDD
jgi:plasmid stability protein